MRRALPRLALAMLLVAGAAAPAAAQQELKARFSAFLEKTIKPAARKAGVPEAVLERELARLTPDTRLPGLGDPDAPERPASVNYQAEFRAPAHYFKADAFRAHVARGRQLAKTHASLLLRIERRYGVPGRIVLAIWARESGYGRAKIPHDALRTLATRAFMGDRRDYFAGETVAALRILAEGHISRKRMRSSWGGALGPATIHAFKLPATGGRFRWRRTPRHLALGSRHAGVHRQLSRLAWLGEGTRLGVRGRDPRLRVLHAGGTRPGSADLRMGRGRRAPRPCPPLPEARTGSTGLPADAGRASGPGPSSPRKISMC